MVRQDVTGHTSVASFHLCLGEDRRTLLAYKGMGRNVKSPLQASEGGHNLFALAVITTKSLSPSFGS